MHRYIMMVVLGLAVAGCAEADRPSGEPPVATVNVDTVGWFMEGRMVDHAGANWLMVGPPVYEPVALTRVGEFEGTPLYAERGEAEPQRRLYIPVGGGYWQMLERGAPPPDPSDASYLDPDSGEAEPMPGWDNDP